ncbi:E3 ubiquitin-protein ligase TRIM39-like [Colossoma macropomum]|uniref:E3 ubiquitin-protein ligase TRIM39-like n=1 Tax=Colossoma macropomum TaxID=42526 RepID=UPI001863AA39|nr:E3 ubiquitin-protein ligase TRIM39-like [Colossoma macropomum]
MMDGPESHSCECKVSSWSKERPAVQPLDNRSKNVDRPVSPSSKSDKSLEVPFHFKEMNLQENKSTITDRPESPSCESEVSGWSAKRPVELKGKESLNHKSKNVDRPVSPSCKSAVSDKSLDMPLHFKDMNLLENKSLLSGFASTADSGISMTISNCSHEDPQEHRLSSRYAEAGDVACDLCKGPKRKAFKSCMTCLASFCETHVRDHYTVEALQRHLLVEVTKNLNVLQENAQLKKTIKEARDENQTLKRQILTLKKENAILRFPDYIWKEKLPVAADVVLDPATAHRSLILSDDRKQVRLGEKKTVDHRAQRFDKYECVLATEGFSSGWHYWEVEVNKEFTIGVTRESAQRKGKFTFSPSVGYWCLYHYRQSFTALEEPSRPLPIDTVPRVMGVCIDMGEKWVTFYNTETKTHIYTFENMDFADGEKIYPVFNTLEKSADLKIRALRRDLYSVHAV